MMPTTAARNSPIAVTSLQGLDTKPPIPIRLR
jgi:hypothetical protein